MFSKLKPKSEFTKNVLTLMTGTTIAQAILVAISPMSTRIYTPKDFGFLALYMSAQPHFLVFLPQERIIVLLKKNILFNIFFRGQNQ